MFYLPQKTKKIIIFLIYLSVILFIIPPKTFSLPNQIAFILYSLFIFWIVVNSFDHESEANQVKDEKQPKLLWQSILIFSVIFLIASRLIMFLRYGETPLGYDTGFYWQYFIQIMYYGTSQGYLGAGNVAYDAWFPFYFLGFSAIPVINILHILHQFITAGALYFLVRSFRPLASRLALAVVMVLFALSINQFMAFWWMFYKQSMAIPFLLLALGLFLRRSWWAIPVAAFAAAIHLQSAIPFGIAFFIFFLYQVGIHIIKKQPMDRELLYIGLSGVAAGLLLIILKGPQDLLSYLEYFKQYNGFSSNAPSWEIAQAKGLFIPFSTFRLNTLFYLPFALTGILTMRSWLFDKMTMGRSAIIPILFFVSLILASFPFLYQNRTLIVLDLILIVFAAYPITIFVKQFLHDRAGKIILGLFSIGFLLFSSRIIWNNPPQIYSEEAREIKATTQLRKPGDYAMALTSLYTPWVYAYTSFEQTIAPGWLQWDKWDLKMWQSFWNGNSDARRLELLNIYGDYDIYMFAGAHFSIPPNLKKFLETNPHVTKISHNVWRYSPTPPDAVLTQ